MEEYRASGLGLKRFAAEHGLKVGQLHYWVYDGRKPRVAEAAAPLFREARESVAVRSEISVAKSHPRLSANSASPWQESPDHIT